MITLTNATKYLQQNRALNDVTLTLEEGHILGLIGSNGAGKSTLLRLLSGIYQVDSGEVLIDNEPIFENVERKKNIFFISDETVQFNSFSLTDLKNFYQPYYKNFSEEIYEQLVQITELPLNQKMSQFSKGMKRQAILIIGLASMTDYLFLDEAFDGIDQTMRLTVKRIIIDAVIDRKLTVIISSHHLSELNEICDTIGLMHKGKLICMHDTDELKKNATKAEFFSNVERYEEDFSLSKLLYFKKAGNSYTIVLKETTDKTKEILSNMQATIHAVYSLNLDELFLYEMEAQGYDSKQI